MSAPWYVYIIAVLIALPAYILWATGAYMLGKFVWSWLTISEAPPPGPQQQVSAKG